MRYLILFLFICSTANAASLSDVLTWKYGNCMGTKQADENDANPNPKMVIQNWKCSDPQPAEKEIEQLQADYLASTEYAAKSFDARTFKQSLYLSLVDDEDKFIRLAPYWGVFSELLEFENFSGVKSLIQGLQKAGVLTEDDVQTISNIFVINGIDLGKV